MKIKLLENHQLPKGSIYLFTDHDIKRIFNTLERISVFKSNHVYTFDKSYGGKKPKIKGCVVCTLAHTAHDNFFFHLYGCKKEVLDKITTHAIENTLIPRLSEWPEQSIKLSKMMPKHRMLVVEIENEKLTFHELGK